MGDLVLQAGTDSVTGSKDPKLGISAIRVKCWAANIIDALYAPCPDIGVILVENQPRTFNRSKAGDTGGYDVEITLEGIHDGQEDGERWSIEGTTSEDSIESHPDYATLLQVYNGSEDANTNRAVWPKTIGTKNERNPMHQVESYLVPGLVLTRRYTADFVPDEVVRGLGTIDDPPPPKNSTVKVRLTGKRNWLKIRARVTDRGNKAEIEESWLLSGPAGWTWEMYRNQVLT